MTEKKSDLERRAELRKQAEAKLAATGDADETLPVDVDGLVHELRTHQIELEMQNEELRSAQADLLDSRDRYAHLYDYAPVGYTTVSAKGIIEDANLTLAQMVKANRGTLQKQPISAFILPDDQDSYYHCRRELLAKKRNTSCELRMIRKDNEPFWARLDLALVDPSIGNDSPLRVVISDIDLARQEVEEHRARQVELQERLARSEKLEALGILAGGVAHDLNNVMGPMVALPEIISEDLDNLDTLNVEETQETLEMIRGSAHRAAAIVRDLVSLGRRGRYDFVHMSISQIQGLSVDCNVIKRLRTEHPKVTFSIKPDNVALVISGDESQLSRAVVNVVRNAAESIHGEGTVTIKTSKKSVNAPLNNYEIVPQGDYAVIELSDTGEGITKEQLDQIFEPFYTRKKRSERSGSGLGLAVVHGIVKDHKGFIDVKSEVGKGSVFTVYLPLVYLPKDKKGKDEPEGAPVVGGTERILVVDDEPSQRFLSRKSLERLGYEVAEAEDGHQALAYFESAKRATKESPYDLILMDMIMEEGFDGVDAYKAILKLYPNQKVIIASGHSEDGRAKDGVDLGAHWLAKPYEKDDLARIVREGLDRD